MSDIQISSIENEEKSTLGNPANGVTPMNEKPRKKKSRTPLIIFILLLIAAACGGGYYYYEQMNAQNMESNAYQRLETSENVEDYQAFLDAYPKSQFVRDVQKRMQKLKDMYETWEELCICGTQNDFLRFKQNYPKSLLLGKADLKIDSLDWADAKHENTAEAVEAYLKNHPNGKYIIEANDLAKKIQDTQADPEELAMISNAIHTFYDAFGANNVDRVYSVITPTMTRFLNKANATKVDVGEIITSTYTSHIKSCRFTVNDDFKTTKVTDSENNVTYDVEFTVDQHIIRDNEGKTFGSYMVNATLTGQYMISALTMKEVSRK